MIELIIRFDGDFPGLAEKRLSIDAFGKPLEQLLIAARRIATGIITDAVDESERGAEGGRVAKQAERLDIQIGQVGEGSIKLPMIVTMVLATGTQAQLFDELPERTGRVLIEAVRDEGAGRPRNARVRKYLESLPRGITSQSYALLRDGEQLDAVSIGQVTLAEAPAELPYVIAAEGHVVGVGFEPGRNEVRIKSQDGTVTCVATAEQVESALALRAAGTVGIKAVVMPGKGTRLIEVRPPGDVATPLTNQALTAIVFDRWADLLARLA